MQIRKYRRDTLEKTFFDTTREIKLQSFQYRILHSTITCRKKLYDMKLVDSPNCLSCNNIDDIKQFLLSCEKTRNFWQSFSMVE